MKFSLLLVGLLLKLRSAAKKHPSFKERLKEQDFILLIRTRDEARGRYFIFSDGEVFSRKGIHARPDVALVWKTADLGFNIMAKGDREASMQAREDGDLVVEGDAMKAVWFTETVTLMRNLTTTQQPLPPKEEKVAVIGLGNMGAGIARNIAKAGFDLTVYNRTASKVKPFTDAGATAAASPKEAAARADIVITCLMGDDSVLETVEGTTGLLAGMKPGAIHIGTSTVSPQCAAKLARLHAEQGSHYVAGPVLGRPDVAEAGELVTFVAGETNVIDQCKPVLDAYTRMVRTVSDEHRLANTLKLCANYVAASAIELMGQVYTFGEKSGLDTRLLEELFQAMWAHPGLKEYATRIRGRDFDSEGGFAMTGGLKDVQLMLDASEAVGAALEYGQIVKSNLREGIDRGMGNRDWSGTYEVTRIRSGLKSSTTDDR
jgi:3-hydroxyisobutyrate dehydrogenase-like beta-hydroxyacid dehydrogenase